MPNPHSQRHLFALVGIQQGVQGTPSEVRELIQARNMRLTTTTGIQGIMGDYRRNEVKKLDRWQNTCGKKMHSWTFHLDV
jgi:hypothetical protein